MTTNDDEKAFLATIAQNPNDTAPRLVFADWLEERGDPRGAWIRDPELFAVMGPNAENPIPKLLEELERVCPYRRYEDDEEEDEALVHVRGLLKKIGPPLIGPLLEFVEQLPKQGRGSSRIHPMRPSLMILFKAQEKELGAHLPKMLEFIKDRDAEISYTGVNLLVLASAYSETTSIEFVKYLQSSRILANNTHWIDCFYESRGIGLPLIGRFFCDFWKEELSQAENGSGWILQTIGKYFVAINKYLETESLLSSEEEDFLEEMFQAIEAGLNHPSERANKEAAQVLKDLGDTQSSRLEKMIATCPADQLVNLFNTLEENDDRLVPFLKAFDNPKTTSQGLTNILAFFSKIDVSPYRGTLKRIAQAIQEGSDSFKVKAFRAWSSSTITDERIVELLEEGLASEAVEVRRAASEIVTRSGFEPDTYDRLITIVLADPEQSIRNDVAKKMDEYKLVARISKHLKSQLRDNEPRTRQEALIALGSLLPHDKDIVSIIAKGFTDRELNVRRTAFRMVSESSQPVYGNWLSTFRKATQDNDPHIRQYAAMAMSNIDLRDEKDRELILDLTEDEHPRVRAGAVYALGNASADEPKLFKWVKRGLKDEDEMIVEHALRGINPYFFHTPEVQQAILDAIANTKKYSLYRAGILKLSEIRPRRYTPETEAALWKVITSDDMQLISEVADKLSYDDRNYPFMRKVNIELFTNPKYANFESCTSAIREKLETLELLLTKFSHPDSSVRYRIYKLLQDAWTGYSVPDHVTMTGPELDDDMEGLEDLDLEDEEGDPEGHNENLVGTSDAHPKLKDIVANTLMLELPDAVTSETGKNFSQLLSMIVDLGERVSYLYPELMQVLERSKPVDRPEIVRAISCLGQISSQSVEYFKGMYRTGSEQEKAAATRILFKHPSETQEILDEIVRDFTTFSQEFRETVCYAIWTHRMLTPINVQILLAVFTFRGNHEYSAFFLRNMCRLDRYEDSIQPYLPQFRELLEDTPVELVRSNLESSFKRMGISTRG